MMDKYDVIIVGGGPAGLTAGLYTSRAKLNSLLIEKAMIGGQMTNVGWIENFPGFPDGIGGFELGQLIQQQVEKYGLKIVTSEVTGIESEGSSKKVVRTTDSDFETKTVIIASAASRQKLGVPGEEEFSGRGVSYCATCDGPLFQDQPVAVIGGGDVAITEALHLAQFASKVIVIHRRDHLRATAILQEKAFAESKIEFLWDTTIEKIEGEDFVKKLSLNQVKTGEKSTMEIVGVFVSIGFKPDTGFLNGLLPLDGVGHIITNEKMETAVPGIFAAGDIRHNSARQAITAAGDGATAAIYSQRFITEQ